MTHDLAPLRSEMTLQLRFEAPIPSEQARANGISPNTTHLLISFREESEADQRRFGQAVEQLLSASTEVIALVFGSFEAHFGAQSRSNKLGSVLGSTAFKLPTKEAWSQLSEVRAEWIAVIDRDPSEFDIVATRLNKKRAGLFKLTKMTELGELASEPDLIDPLLVLYPLNQTLELFGSMQEILKRFDLVRPFILKSTGAS